MHRTYQIITDATADMVPEMLVGLPEVQVIPMGVTLGKKAYTYGPGGPAMPRRGYGKADWIHIRFYRETQVALFCKQEGMGPDFIKFRKLHSRGEKKRGASPPIRAQSQDMPPSPWKMGITWGGERWP